jgi:hypothetical protein
MLPMSCHVCALQCHVRFPSHSCRHADGCRRMAADCALPDAVAEARGCRVSNSHSATECPRCRPRTVGDMHSTRLPPSSPPATTRRRTAGPPPGPRPPEAPPRVRDPAPARGHGATSRRVSRVAVPQNRRKKVARILRSFNRVSLATPHRGLARVAKAQIVSPRSRHRERAATAHRGDTGERCATPRAHTRRVSHRGRTAQRGIGGPTSTDHAPGESTSASQQQQKVHAHGATRSLHAHTASTSRNAHWLIA